MKPIWIVVISVVVTGGLIGGGTYYLMNKQANDDKASLQTQIDDLSQKFADSETALAAATKTPAATSTVAPTTATTVPAATTTTSVFSLSNLKSSYVTISGTSYQLTNGVYTHPGVGPFAPEVPSTITLDQKNIAIDSANPNQAAIILAVGGMRHAGATVDFNELEIMTNSSGVPKYLARILPDGLYQSTINSISFASNVVTISIVPFQQTAAVTKTYRLTGSTLTDITPATTSSVSDTNVFSLANLKAASVTINGTSYQLINGSYSNSNPGYNLPSSIVLDESHITIDSANSQQVAVILAVQYGGNGVSKILEVMGNKGGKPQHIADAFLNDGTVADIQSVSFGSDTIVVDMLVLGPTDPNSSPSLDKKATYKLTADSKLVLQ